MKKILCLFLLAACYTVGYSNNFKNNNLNEINSYYITEKGKSYMRKDLVSSEDNKFGLSGSLQNIEYVNGTNEFHKNSDYRGYSAKTQGFVTGTSSEFNTTGNSMWLTGVSFGYLRSEIDYDEDFGKDDAETLGVNAYLGYNKNDYMLITYIGGALGDNDKSGDKDNLLVGIEGGKFFTICKKNKLYPYVSLEGSRVYSDNYSYSNVSYDKTIENYTKFNLGLDYDIKFEKIELKLFGKYTDVLNDDNEMTVEENGLKREISTFDSYKDGVSFGGTLAYYIEKDLYVALDIFTATTDDTDDFITSFRLGHIF